MKNETIVAFHIGRGGHYHNPGYLSFIGEKKIGDFTDNLYSSFSHEKDFKDRFGFDSTGNKNQKCILDLITDRDFYELEEKFGITEEMLGEEIYFDDGGNDVGLTEKDVESGIGKINIDYEYNTTYTCYLSECDERQLMAILENEMNASNDIIDYCKEKIFEENF